MFNCLATGPGPYSATIDADTSATGSANHLGDGSAVTRVADRTWAAAGGTQHFGHELQDISALADGILHLVRLGRIGKSSLRGSGLAAIRSPIRVPERRRQDAPQALPGRLARGESLGGPSLAAMSSSQRNERKRRLRRETPAQGVVTACDAGSVSDALQHSTLRQSGRRTPRRDWLGRAMGDVAAPAHSTHFASLRCVPCRAQPDQRRSTASATWASSLTHRCCGSSSSGRVGRRGWPASAVAFSRGGY
jgi:hypothetical protein